VLRPQLLALLAKAPLRVGDLLPLVDMYRQLDRTDLLRSECVLLRPGVLIQLRISHVARASSVHEAWNDLLCKRVDSVSLPFLAT